MITRKAAGTIAKRVESWFRKASRDLPWRTDYDPYHVWISEFMAQQTRMEVVLGYFEGFIEKFPSIRALAAADEEEVVAAWSGLGYYRRARMLHRSACEIVERFDGELPRDVETLRTLHGFGPYTAGAVASIAYDERAAIVDGNVARVVARLEAIDAPWRSRDLEKRAWSVAELLTEVCDSPRALNQGLMELGARVCRPKNPDCGGCPVSTGCSAYVRNAVDNYPRPAPRKATVELEIPTWIIEDDRGRLLFRRAEGRLMKGMFQLPQGNDLLFSDPIEIEDRGLEIGTVSHTITNRRIRFRLFTPRMPDSLAESNGEWRWIAPDRLAEHPHPSWVKKAIELWMRSR